MTSLAPYGKMMTLIGLLLGMPLLVIPFYPAELSYAPAFLIPMVISLVLGRLAASRLVKGRLAANRLVKGRLTACLLVKGRLTASRLVKDRLTSQVLLRPEWQSSLQRGSLPVLFVWCYSFLLGAVPFVIAGQLSITHGLFESVSGWTTTGLTVANVETLPHVFLFHRSFMQYCGGLGFVLMMVMFVQNKQSMELYSAEGHLDRLMPNLKQTARIIFALYTFFLLAGATLYRLFGMALFDAVCHTMSALSTAGFTTQTNSIGAYNSLPIELVTVALMLIGATNFAVLLLLAKRKIKQVFRIAEVKCLIGVVVIFVPFIALSLTLSSAPPIEQQLKQQSSPLSIGVNSTNSINSDYGDTSDNVGIGEINKNLRHGLFGVVTVFSTTGYATMDYAAWPPFALGLVMLLMMIGGSAGSTAGGIKLNRIYLLLRITIETVRKWLTPACRVPDLTYQTVRGKTPVDHELVADTFAFIACYMGVLIAGTLAITLTADCTLFDALFEFTSALGTVGISNGLTNAQTNTPTLVIEMIGMILGRLEVFIVFIGLYESVRMVKESIRMKWSLWSGRQE